MTTTRTLLIAALAVSLVAAAPAAAGVKAKRAPCAKRGSTTLASSSLARVYRSDVPDGGADGMTLDKVYGCWRSGDRRTLLATEYDDDYVTSGTVDRIVLGGRFVLVLYTATDVSCKADCPTGYEPSSTNLAAFNLKARKRRTLGTGKIDAKSLKITGNT